MENCTLFYDPNVSIEFDSILEAAKHLKEKGINTFSMRTDTESISVMNGILVYATKTINGKLDSVQVGSTIFKST